MQQGKLSRKRGCKGIFLLQQWPARAASLLQEDAIKLAANQKCAFQTQFDEIRRKSKRAVRSSGAVGILLIERGLQRQICNSDFASKSII